MNKEKNLSTPILLKAISPQIFLQTSSSQNFKKAAFILSSGRTGTNFLAKYIDKHPNAIAIHEPGSSWRIRMWTIAYFEGKVSEKTMARVLKSYRQNDTQNGALYVESNPYLVGFSNVIGEVFNDPVIIHIVRDPRSYIKSSLNHGNATGLKYIANKYFPFWHVDIEQILGTKPKSLQGEVAGYWRIVNEHLLKAKKNYSNYHLFHFERLFKKDTDAFDQLIEVLGLDFSRVEDKIKKDRQINKSQSRYIPSWQEWSKEECREVAKLCSPLMQQLGYGQEDAWKDKIQS